MKKWRVTGSGFVKAGIIPYDTMTVSLIAVEAETEEEARQRLREAGCSKWSRARMEEASEQPENAANPASANYGQRK